MKSKIHAFILAAGKGTRMKSSLPKVLHECAGNPLIYYPLQCLSKLKIPTTVIISKESSSIKRKILEMGFKDCNFAIQDPPLGTGHAVMTGLNKLKIKAEQILVLNGDMPLISIDSIKNLIQEKKKAKTPLAFLTASLNKNIHYGRVIRDESRHVQKVVEFKDASIREKEINEMNIGTYLFCYDFIKSEIKKLKTQNKQKEYYLTDLIEKSYDIEIPAFALKVSDTSEAMGVNSQAQLDDIEQVIHQKRRESFANKGVRFIQGQSIVIGPKVQIEAGAKIAGPTYLLGQTKIKKEAVIEAFTWIKDSQISEGAHIKAHSYLSEAKVQKEAQIGPSAHLRPGANIGPSAKVGNFSEVKKSKIGEGSKINHLSYIGDATIGKKVNIGAGTITCNYDGVKKYKTILEDEVFVGSDTQFIAPVKIKKGAFIGAGSTITKDVAPKSLALSRSPQKEIKKHKKKKN